MFLNAYASICKFGKVRKTEETLADFSEKFECLKKKKIYHFAFALFSKDMLRIVKGFAPWILFEMFEGKVSISIGVPGGPLGFMRLIRVGILQGQFTKVQKRNASKLGPNFRTL